MADVERVALVDQQAVDDYAHHLAGVLYVIAHKADAPYISYGQREHEHRVAQREYGITMSCCGDLAPWLTEATPLTEARARQLLRDRARRQP